MPNPQNLIAPKPGEVRNPKGRPGAVNRKTILNFFLFEADVKDLGVLDSLTNRPKWLDTTKPKTLYEMMTLAQAIKAISGDTQAFRALNDAIGIHVDSEQKVDVVHIFKPNKVSLAEFNQMGAELSKHTRQAVEAEVVDDQVASPTGPADSSLTSPE